MPFISNTDKERQEMLQAIGVKNFHDLLVNIPEEFLYKELCCLEPGYSELEITRKIKSLAARNLSLEQVNSFLGGGIYDHFIPAAVDHIIQRPEFHSAYTPYQAEVSQGTLQYIYEYQTMICDLTGMEISNAGMYDGASATAEAILMAARKTGKYRAVLSGLINPCYRDVIRSYTEGIGIELVYSSARDGVTDYINLRDLCNSSTACVVVQSPNFLGYIEDMEKVRDTVREKGSPLFIAVVDPISLAILKPPGTYAADIAVGEGQALGNFPNYGGPLFGFLATRMELARTMPGRIVGATVDVEGKRAYALTLQAREQHIRREKATSNICSNQALCNLAATVYLSLLGKRGLQEVARQCLSKAHYLAGRITQLKGFQMVATAPFFKEFAISTTISPGIIIKKLKERKIFPGIDLERFGFNRTLLIAVTEKKRKTDLDELVSALQEVQNG
ncbi:MAG: aminomethyl-transferring glycine dehydrogenase subunit GcvPA [Candidatus Cloacimonetes bacterium]|nr:aminomethyl-transferring glycine dehydrogenase subunit GcvPA [Candidatus Cloacimonadota bacterium]